MIDVPFLRDVLLPPLARGLLVTLQLIFLSIPFGLVLGTAIAIGRAYGNIVLSFPCRLYVILFKGCPLLMLLFILYFGLPSTGITLSPFTAAVIGFVLCNAAYQSEHIRGGIRSMKSAQMEAALSVGMTERQAIKSIILPQAMRRALPGISNEIIYLIKYSSLAYMLTCIELTGAGKIVASRSFRFTLVFGVVGMIYLFLVYLASKGLEALEKKLHVPGLIK